MRPRPCNNCHIVCLCQACGRFVTLAEFDAREHVGHQPHCKLCKRRMERERREKNKK